ncbi:MAG TPA: hypothetical protein VFI90_06795 [Rubrobacter sp.]|nr:hypothetical protein [Rubrobacter sp.]
MAALVVVVVGTVPEKVDAASKFKLVTWIFRSTSSISVSETDTVGASAPYPSPIDVSDLRRVEIRDDNVILQNNSVDSSDDMDVMFSHRGLNRTIFSDVGGDNNVVDTTFAFDDEAAVLLQDTTPPNRDSIKPTFLKKVSTEILPERQCSSTQVNRSNGADLLQVVSVLWTNEIC